MTDLTMPGLTMTNLMLGALWTASSIALLHQVLEARKYSQGPVTPADPLPPRPLDGPLEAESDLEMARRMR